MISQCNLLKYCVILLSFKQRTKEYSIKFNVYFHCWNNRRINHGNTSIPICSGITDRRGVWFISKRQERKSGTSCRSGPNNEAWTTLQTLRCYTGIRCFTICVVYYCFVFKNRVTGSAFKNLNPEAMLSIAMLPF